MMGVSYELEVAEEANESLANKSLPRSALEPPLDGPDDCCFVESPA